MKGMKSVKLPVNSSVPQPPLDAEMMPLSQRQLYFTAENMGLTPAEQLRR